MEPEDSLLCSQEPISTPYPEPVKILLYTLILILSFHIFLGLSSSFLPSGFPFKINLTFLNFKLSEPEIGL